MAKAAEGKGRCAMCGEPIIWRKNDMGTMSYFCQLCDFQGYAKAGTEANKLAMEEVEKFKAVSNPPIDTRPATKPAAAVQIKPAAQAPAAKSSSGLLMG